MSISSNDNVGNLNVSSLPTDKTPDPGTSVLYVNGAVPADNQVLDKITAPPREEVVNTENKLVKAKTPSDRIALVYKYAPSIPAKKVQKKKPSTSSALKGSDEDEKKH